MHHLYDFGISQEDPRTELSVLDIRAGDHVLCVASGGEVPLSVLSLQPGVRVTTVDISREQLILCRLKLQAALAFPFPLNGQFLGYGAMMPKSRWKLYQEQLCSLLDKEDQDFWLANRAAIENGVIHCGRFEGYIRKLRKIAALLIGKKNIRALLASTSVEEQQMVFDQRIAPRKAIRYLFRIAFHPALYKNRGLCSKALMHAPANTGELFFQKFRSFCTATPARKNYFLQYFLTGSCNTVEAFPEYLQEDNRAVLAANKEHLILKLSSLQAEMALHQSGTFSKIHLSNIGDWMGEEEFRSFQQVLKRSCNKTTKLCYRFLLKNHFESEAVGPSHFHVSAINGQLTDRFPFYSILSIQVHDEL